MHANSEILAHFNLTEAEFIGAGSETAVYQLTPTQIVRIHGFGTKLAQIENKQRFYNQLNTAHLPFAVPKIDEIGSVADLFYTIEPRLSGRELTAVIPTLTPEERKKTIHNFIKTAALIRTIRINGRFYGELLTHTPIRTESWTAFLSQRIQTTLKMARPTIIQDMPQLDDKVAAWYAQFPILGNVQPQLVHGDYYFGNVLANERGEITAVLDFSATAVLGDWRLDLLTALIFLELTPNCLPQDSQTARPVIETILGHDATQLETFYRIYYAFYYAFTQESDPPLYEWCVKNLNAL